MINHLFSGVLGLEGQKFPDFVVIGLDHFAADTGDHVAELVESLHGHLVFGQVSRLVDHDMGNNCSIVQG